MAAHIVSNQLVPKILSQNLTYMDFNLTLYKGYGKPYSTLRFDWSDKRMGKTTEDLGSNSYKNILLQHNIKSE